MRSHGCTATYDSGCRCPDCTEANRLKAVRTRQDRARRLRADPSLAEHGQQATYCNWGCRCLPCSTAQATYHKIRRTT